MVKAEGSKFAVVKFKETYVPVTGGHTTTTILDLIAITDTEEQANTVIDTALGSDYTTYKVIKAPYFTE